MDLWPYEDPVTMLWALYLGGTWVLSPILWYWAFWGPAEKRLRKAITSARTAVQERRINDALECLETAMKEEE